MVVLFAFAHPDDETLAAGVAIAAHVAAGHDVHVLLLGRSVTSAALGILNGESTSGYWGVRHDPAAEGYAPLTPERFGRARLDECRRALDCLAAGRRPVALHEAGLADGYGADAAAAAIRAAADAIRPAGRLALAGHSPLVDDHPDHVAIGEAVARLGAREPARFGNPRHYVLPRYWSDARLSGIGRAWEWPADAGIRARARNAGRAYGAWAPPYSYAIGHHSVYGSMFAPLMRSPRSLYHL